MSVNNNNINLNSSVNKLFITEEQTNIQGKESQISKMGNGSQNNEFNEKLNSFFQKFLLAHENFSQNYEIVEPQLEEMEKSFYGGYGGYGELYNCILPKVKEIQQLALSILKENNELCHEAEQLGKVSLIMEKIHSKYSQSLLPLKYSTSNVVTETVEVGIKLSDPSIIWDEFKRVKEPWMSMNGFFKGLLKLLKKRN